MSQADLALFHPMQLDFCNISSLKMNGGFTASSQTVHVVETPVLSPSKEGQGGVIGREGDGLNLLGCKGHCVPGLPSGRPNYQRRVLCQPAEAVAKGNQAKTAWETDGGGPVLPGQSSCT